jgi:hypothetical protein
MAAALLVAIGAFTLLYLYLIALRLRVGRLEDRALAEALSPRVGVPVRALLGDDDREPAEDAGPVPAGEGAARG